MDTAPTPPPGKRGRRQSLPDPAAGPVAAFAHALATLKIGAGDPSYDRMRAELGAMASKSALSAAARGQELPSWETTWEFVRSLAPPGSDPDELRRHWRRRWDAARTGCGEPATASAAPRGHRRLLAVGLLVGAAVAGVLWLLVGASTAPAPPLEGDAATFVADVTIPDGSVVAGGERFVKTWELRNSGSVTWTGRYLERLPGRDGAACRTPDRVPVPPTAPGAPVRVSVTVDTPPGPAACTVHWKMVDGQGRVCFPRSRPLFFEVSVSPG